MREPTAMQRALMPTRPGDLTRRCAFCGEELPRGGIGLLWFAPGSNFYPDTDLDKVEPCACDGRREPVALKAGSK